MRSWTSAGIDQTLAVGRELAAELRPDGVLLLTGPLGAGKTVLAQGLAEGLGIDPLQVQSPTYTLIREHRVGDVVLVHVDLYRLEPEDIPAVGLDEILGDPGVKVVEWAERLPDPPPQAVWLDIERYPGGRRRITRRAAG